MAVPVRSGDAVEGVGLKIEDWQSLGTDMQSERNAVGWRGTRARARESAVRSDSWESKVADEVGGR
jgi:hypothetical protein